MLPLVLVALLDDPSRESEFETFVDRCQKSMIRVANDVLQNYHDAEEAVLTALIGIAKHFSKIAGEDGAAQQAYACRAARNAALNLLRSREKREKKEIPLEAAPEPGVDDKGLLRLCETVSAEILDACLKELPAEYRDVFLLYYYENRSTRRIAAALSLKRENVKTMLKRGRLLLKKALEERGFAQ
jgi:RNA polymerase sigma-70 factor (ECF subfamily)